MYEIKFQNTDGSLGAESSTSWRTSIGGMIERSKNVP